MPRGGGPGRGGSSRGRGKGPGHKGQRRHFTNPEELDAQKEKELRKKQWRAAHGEESSSEEGSGDDERGSNSESESESEEEEAAEEGEGAEGEEAKAKGVEGLIEIENPNRVIQKAKKVDTIDVNDAAKPELSRREREEIEKQKAKAHYDRLHASGKTEEACSDMARLAIIRKQREEAAKKREEEQKQREAAKTATKAEVNKALGKGKPT